MPLAECFRCYFDTTDKLNKCIVLDMDETMVHTFDGEQYKNQLLALLNTPEMFKHRKRLYWQNINEDGDKQEIIGIMRPYLDEFLVYCLQTFKTVIVWSAGTKEYVNEVVRNIFRDIGSPDYILTRDDSEIKKDKKDKIISLKKNLSLIVDKINDIKLVNMNNILLIDDNQDYVNSLEHGNYIRAVEYRPDDIDMENINDDKFLSQLITFFKSKEFQNCENIKILDKNSV